MFSDVLTFRLIHEIGIILWLLQYKWGYPPRQVHFKSKMGQFLTNQNHILKFLWNKKLIWKKFACSLGKNDFW